MPVSVVKQDQTIEANSIYVIPPGKHISSIDGRFSLFDIEPERGRRVAVDLFLRSLADTHGPHAVGDHSFGSGFGWRHRDQANQRAGRANDRAGTGGSGAFGHAAGGHRRRGWWIGCCASRKCPSACSNTRRVKKRCRSRPRKDRNRPGQPPRRRTKTNSRCGKCSTYLRTRTGHDFSLLQARDDHSADRAADADQQCRYRRCHLDYLRVHAGEAGALLQDLLISVTNFFRDRDSFEALEQHIPDLLRTKHQNDHIRVWVPLRHRRRSLLAGDPSVRARAQARSAHADPADFWLRPGRKRHSNRAGRCVSGTRSRRM